MSSLLILPGKVGRRALVAHQVGERGHALMSKVKQIKVETQRVWKAADAAEMRPVSSSLILCAGLAGD